MTSFQHLWLLNENKKLPLQFNIHTSIIPYHLLFPCRCEVTKKKIVRHLYHILPYQNRYTESVMWKRFFNPAISTPFQLQFSYIIEKKIFTLMSHFSNVTARFHNAKCIVSPKNFFPYYISKLKWKSIERETNCYK